MSTGARKARKRAGVKFERTPKIPTPPSLRVSAQKQIDRDLAKALRRLRAEGEQNDG